MTSANLPSDGPETQHEKVQEESRPKSVRTGAAARRWIFPAIAGVSGIVVGVLGTLAIQGLVGSFSTPEADTRLRDAYSKCGSPVGTMLSDEDRTLTMDVKGQEDSSGASYDDQACVLLELGAPSSVTSHMSQTTSMDGRQSESWDGLTVAWSFHPDRGSDMVVTVTPEG